MTLTFVTGNSYKFEVSKLIAKKLGVSLIQEKLEVPEIQNINISEIASYSAKWAAEKLQKAVIVTDAGYYIEALNGFPGPFIKYINKWLTPEDLLNLMKNKKNRKVTVKWCLAYCEPNKNPAIFISEAAGHLFNHVAGTFKPDATSINKIFIPEGFDKTEAEIPREQMVKFWSEREFSCWKQLVESLKYDNSHWGIGKNDKIPAEIMLPGEIVVATHIRPESPLKLEGKGGRLTMTENGETISDVTYLARPKVWSEQTKSGKSMKRIANFYGRDCLNFNIYSGCEFWDNAVPCKFCSVKPTQLAFGEVEIKKTPAEVKEVAQRAFTLGDLINFIIVTGGSYLDGDKEIDQVVPVLHNIRQTLPKEWGKVIKGNVALMAPNTLEKIDELMATGIQHPSFNLEVWGRENFKDICPGKAKYRGFDHILDAFKYGVDHYGRGVFWVNFVGGLNDLQTLKDGFTYMAEMGVVPGSNIFHSDVGSVIGRTRQSPSVEYIIDLFKHAAYLYHKYDYLPYFDEKCLRNSIANETYLGYV